MPIRTLKGAIAASLRRRSKSPRAVACSEFDYFPVSFNKHQCLRLLSFNIQVGINTQQYRHYLTRSWQHVLPHAKRVQNLNSIASFLPDFDIVALQEVDGGSLRSGFVNQTEYLALRGRFPYWYQQLNRNLGKFAQHSNGLLSRYKPTNLEDHKLPGIIPGRGAIVAEYGQGPDTLLVVMMHLALSRRTRDVQLSYISELVQSYRHVVLMGDMNTHAEQLLNQSPLRGSGLQAAHWEQNTFPSWKPHKSLDHILVSQSLLVNKMEVLNIPISDHLPVAVEIEVPDSVQLSK